jgi:hypothetical protein
MSGMSKGIQEKCILGAAIGNCVHVAGVYQYLTIAESFGYHTIFLGAAVEPFTLIQAIEKYNPKIICISYRLTPKNLEVILNLFINSATAKNLIKGRIYYFGGTPPCIDVARKFKLFDHFFQGEEPFSEICETLFVQSQIQSENYGIYERLPVNTKLISINLMKKIIAEGRYIPMIRHHFGLSSLNDTIEGIKKISDSGQVDLISLGPDQNAQEFFFEPEKMNPSLDGSGGVPIRTQDDLKAIWQATQRGNFPRLRIYAGTQNLLKWADMSVRTINNAWGTIPLFWYSILDGRSKRPIEDAIHENMDVIRWYAERGIPVEVNDSHQWSLRETSDSIAVADFFLAAYNAKKLGVGTYIAQFMFNTPRLSSGKMDLAKMLAKWEMISQLEDDHFICVREVRAGLTHFSVDQDIAKGQLAASTLLAFALKPQILHVVSFSEADHAATSDDVIESCKIVRGVVKNAWRGFPDLTLDKDVITRKNHLIKEAQVILNEIRTRFGKDADDPLSDPRSLIQAVEYGILDAPQLKNNPIALGKIRTMPINGGYDAVDNEGKPILEKDRLKMIAGKSDKLKLFLQKSNMSKV